jgi:hypothetical protein
MPLNTERLGWDMARWTFAVACVVGIITYFTGNLDPIVVMAG